MVKKIIKFFEIEKNNTSVKTEIFAGFTTFLTMSYIVIVNPSILSQAGMPFSALVTTTVLLIVLSTLLMGLISNNPLAIAPGMGLNTFFTYSVVLGQGVAWQEALGAVFWSGILFLILTLLFNLNSIMKGIPKDLKFGISVGIGFFIALIGLKNANIVVPTVGLGLELGNLDIVTAVILVATCITLILFLKNYSSAFTIGIVIITVASLFITPAPESSFKGFFSPPDFSLILRFDPLVIFNISNVPLILAFFYTDVIDSLSFFYAASKKANLVDDQGNPRNFKRSAMVDSFSTILAGSLGTSTGTTYLESLSGISQGGRTGLTSVVVALCFLPFIFFSPLISIVPPYATSPVLIIVGLLMMSAVKDIDWAKSNLEESFPAFISMITIPMTSSISDGIMLGVISWVGIKILMGKIKKISIVIIIIALCSLMGFVNLS